MNNSALQSMLETVSDTVSSAEETVSNVPEETVSNVPEETASKIMANAENDLLLAEEKYNKLTWKALHPMLTDKDAFNMEMEEAKTAKKDAENKLSFIKNSLATPKKKKKVWGWGWGWGGSKKRRKSRKHKSRKHKSRRKHKKSRNKSRRRR